MKFADTVANSKKEGDSIPNEIKKYKISSIFCAFHHYIERRNS
jgi:hypothetical protein